MSDKPEVSVLMPTYNDSKYIAAAIHSVLKQSHRKWELIVVDDGSTDDTPNVMREFTDDRIVHLRQKSSGQLNALMTGVPSIRGKYVTILHSDDELSDDTVFERNVSALKDRDCDGVFGNLFKMDESGTVSETIGMAKSIGASSPATLFLKGGSNIIPDIFFVKEEAFENVLSNYITWNTPYWLTFDGNRVGTLNLKMVEPWYKYRMYPENYIRSDVGKFEATNGCLRTVIEVGQRIDLPFPKTQRLLAKALKMSVKPLFTYKPCPVRHLQEVIRYVVRRYFSVIPENLYFRGLLGFYESYPSQRTISLHVEKNDEIFLGKDTRIFFNLMQSKSLPRIYEHILEEATKGFGKVIVANKEDYEKAQNIMRFLNLLTQIDIA